MKALEKAAKDRNDATASTDATQPMAAAQPVSSNKFNSELTLEPVIVPSPDASPMSRGAVTAPAAIARPPGAEPRTDARDSVKAAAVIRAAARAEPSGNLFSYLRDRPLITFGTVATLFLVGFGGYVYLQMNPGMFATQAARPAPVAAVAQAPASQPAITSPPAAAIAGPLPLTSLLPPTEQANKEKLVSTAAAAAAPAVTTPAPAPAPAAVPSTMPRDTIKVTAGVAAPAINPVLSEAYSALNTGNLEASQRLYNQLLKSDPRNIEALLGLAAIASQQGDRETMTKHYAKVLELDPRNSLAQAGLIGTVGSADPLSAETRVKQLISRDPSSPYLYFTLGNTYVDQLRWSDAQQAFFQAHHLQPENPDYAYNLAIALEHIGQPKSAIDFYRRAIVLATAKGHANFSPSAVQGRVEKLEKVLQ